MSDDGHANVSITRTVARDERGAIGWAYYIGTPTLTDGVSVGYTFAGPRDLIYTPIEPTSVGALETLSGFIGAWAEARDEHSDNWTLFPESVRGICDYAEELSLDLMCEVGEDN